jgi:hypothetical protein
MNQQRKHKADLETVEKDLKTVIDNLAKESEEKDERVS